jgi:threonine dehydrogenase-like Zn-dependent dehydrogenase
MASRVAQHRGMRVIGVDLVPDRLDRAQGHGVEVLDLRAPERDIGGTIRELTEGRGPDAVVDAVGMEAHGSPVVKLLQQAATLLPDPVARPAIQHFAIDRLSALYSAIDIVRRGGTISLVGVYGGAVDPLPMMALFDKQIQLRMGQANVKRWIDDLLPLVLDDDALGVEEFATHRLPLDEAPDAYRMFQYKRDGVVKVVLHP